MPKKNEGGVEGREFEEDEEKGKWRKMDALNEYNLN